MTTKKTKADKKDVLDKIHEICISNWDTEYRTYFQSDDGGEHVMVAFEEQVPPGSKEKIMSPFMGWRLIKLVVPEGYLAAFHPLVEK